MAQNTRKKISLLLALVLIFQCGVFAPISADAATSAETSGRVVLGQGLLGYTQVLTDNGDGTFSLALTLEDSSSLRETNPENTVSRNGYFTAPADGFYRVELRGGSGGNGEVGSNAVSDKAGVGGAGGLIYGEIYLTKGQTLYYQLGGNGQQTQSTESGGGANGNGGNAGAATTHTVGGGGGYSAVYLFDATEFEKKYLNVDGSMKVADITEEDRISKYIMIAGGGGGGGAASGLWLITDAGNAPNGGAGGSIGSVSGSVGNGTFFAGGNGQSSGSSLEYCGQGGTYIPGAVKESWLTMLGLDLFSGIQPNDWEASINPNALGGHGGEGNLRGGAGGAGYMGGSGGLQAEIVWPTNVGGGGGGSSYIANEVNGRPIRWSDIAAPVLPDGNRSYISIEAVSGQNADDDTDDDAQDDVDTKTVTLSFAATKYFSVTTDVKSDVDAGGNPMGTYTLDLTEGAKTIILTFTPVNGFAGGNNVPLLNDNAISVTDGVEAASIPLTAKCAAVNVPLNFQAIGRAHTSNDNTKTYELSSLYDDRYTDIRNDLANAGSNYDFIQAIGEYKVYGSDASTPLAGAVKPENSTAYTVSFDVTPKSGAAAVVGTPVTTTRFSAKATITIVAPGTGYLGGNSVKYEKNLVYRDGAYVLTLNANITSESLDPSEIGTMLYESDGTYKVPADGYYYIQAWGGDGGKGGDSYSADGGTGGYGAYLEGLVYLHAGFVLDIDVGQKGDPGDDHVYVSLFTYRGLGGSGGQPSKVVLLDGNKEFVDTLMIAAGGGGAGGAYVGRAGIGTHDSNIDKYSQTLNGYNMESTSGGVSWKNAGYSTVDSAVSATGDNGKDGYSKNENAAPGNAGISYYNPDYIGVEYIDEFLNEIHFTETTAAANRSFYDYRSKSNSTDENGNFILSSVDHGAVKITCLQLSENNNGSVPTNYSYLARISQYWDIDSYSIFDTSKDEVGAPLTEGNGATEFTKTVTTGQTVDEAVNCTLLEFGNIQLDYNEETVEIDDPGGGDDKIEKKEYSAALRVVLRLKPKQGFLGGNDVPILVYHNTDDQTALQFGMQLRQANPSNGMGADQLNINVSGQEATDFANVAISATSLGTLKASPEGNRTIDQITGPDHVNTVEQGDTTDNGTYLYAWTSRPPVETSDWIDDYVVHVEQVFDSNGNVVKVTPAGLKQTTPYTVVVGLGPSETDNIGAVVVPPVSAYTTSLVVDVIVKPEIVYVLSDMTTTDEDQSDDAQYRVSIEPNQDHPALITPIAGYELKSLTVKHGDDILTENVDYSYDPATGQFVLFAANAVGTITVTAVAQQKTYKITYYYTNTLGANLSVGESFMDNKIPVGTALYSEGNPLLNPPEDMLQKEGYTFQWDWGNGAATAPETMPGRDMLVVGVYKPNQHDVTVKFVKKGTDPAETLAESVVFKDVLFGATVEVTPPAVSGWAPENPSYTFTLTEDGDMEFSVYYTQISGKLNIQYVFKNGTQAADPYSRDITVNDQYEITSPGITGYTPNVSVVSGTVTGEQAENGINVVVTYSPNQYTVTLDPGDGASVEFTERTVEFGNIYNYDPQTGGYPGLPTPVKVGYQFLGWYIGETKITGDTVVEIAEDTTMVARWQAQMSTVTIVFQDEFGNPIEFENGSGEMYSYVQLTGEVGSAYSYEALPKDGYTHEPISVSGTYTAVAQRVTIVYTLKDRTYQIIIQFVDPESNVIGSTTRECIGGQGYTVEFTVPDGWITGATSPISGTMPFHDLTIQIPCYKPTIQQIVSITVNWGTLDFNYSQGAWDPESHTYNATIEPTNRLGNTITVTNSLESTMAVRVSYSYSPYAGYEPFEGYFSEDENGVYDAVTNFVLGVGQTDHVYFWLKDNETPYVSGTIESGTTGTCTVTITGG